MKIASRKQKKIDDFFATIYLSMLPIVCNFYFDLNCEETLNVLSMLLISLFSDPLSFDYMTIDGCDVDR